MKKYKVLLFADPTDGYACSFEKEEVVKNAKDSIVPLLDEQINANNGKLGRDAIIKLLENEETFSDDLKEFHEDVMEDLFCMYERCVEEEERELWLQDYDSLENFSSSLNYSDIRADFNNCDDYHGYTITKFKK